MHRLKEDDHLQWADNEYHKLPQSIILKFSLDDGENM
jgi:hypothetical protein